MSSKMFDSYYMIAWSSQSYFNTLPARYLKYNVPTTIDHCRSSPANSIPIVKLNEKQRRFGSAAQTINTRTDHSSRGLQGRASVGLLNSNRLLIFFQSIQKSSIREIVRSRVCWTDIKNTVIERKRIIGEMRGRIHQALRVRQGKWENKTI